MTKPASARSTKSASASVAYDLGRRGEPMPTWVSDDPKLVQAYERGVDDLDGAGGEQPKTPRTTARRAPGGPRSAGRPHSTTRSPRRPAEPAPAAPATPGRPVVGRAGEVGGTQAPVSMSVPRPTLRLGGDGTGLALGLVLYALGINYIRHGWPGVTGWLRAKFLNRPMAETAERGTP